MKCHLDNGIQSYGNNGFIEQDLETFDLEDFKYNFVNISAFRMVDADNEVTINLLKDMEEFQPIGQNILNRTNVIQVLLLIESLSLF